MDRAARLLRGTLRVRVESAFPERVLNLCGAHGIAFSDLRWESASTLSFTVRAAERKKLERLLAPLDAALTVERAAGRPFLPAPLSPPLHAARRAGIHARAVLCQFLLHLGF